MGERKRWVLFYKGFKLVMSKFNSLTALKVTEFDKNTNTCKARITKTQMDSEFLVKWVCFKYKR